MNVQQTINHAYGGTLPERGIYTGMLAEQNTLAPGTDFINIFQPPQNCHCFYGIQNIANSQICIIPANLTNTIVTTNGMNGCSIYIYRANNHFIFFHNWNDNQIRNPQDIQTFRNMVNAKALQEHIPNWIEWNGPIIPKYTIKWNNYSSQMQNRAGNENIFCFIPLLFPIGNNHFRAWFLFFERNFHRPQQAENPNALWTYDRHQSKLMDL